jgi:1-acyl-sn-glycerol-3-phosphate acyltransferase
MLPIFRSAWIWAATATLIIVWVPVLATVRLFDRDPLRTRTARWFRRLGRAITRVNPWRLHITGSEHIQPGNTYVVVSNHQSLADIPLITHLRIDAKWLAKAELFRTPVVGWLLRMAGDVPVERSDRRKAAHALLQCARLLKRRCSLVFFPEGTRSATGEILPFNEGPFQLAIREKIPVLPLVVDGSGDALPRSTWLFRGTQDIYLRVLEPILPTGQTSQFRDLVRERMIEELIRMRAAPAR